MLRVEIRNWNKCLGYVNHIYHCQYGRICFFIKEKVFLFCVNNSLRVIGHIYWLSIAKILADNIELDIPTYTCTYADIMYPHIKHFFHSCAKKREGKKNHTWYHITLNLYMFTVSESTSLWNNILSWTLRQWILPLWR